MIKSRLCDLIGIKYPIIQAGMGPFSNNNLGVASANAGVLGLLSTSGIVSRTDQPWVYKAWVSTSGANEDDDVTKGAMLELTPGARTTLAAGYRYIETGPQVMTIFDYAASTKPYDFLSIIGSYRDRELATDRAPDTTLVQLALAPAGYFSLTGDYQINPEDKKGVIQPYNSTSLGLSTKIGSVALNSGFTAKDEYLSRRLSDERRFGVELPWEGHQRPDYDRIQAWRAARAGG